METHPINDSVNFQHDHLIELARRLNRTITIFDLETTTFRGRPNFGIMEVACISVVPVGASCFYGHLINPGQPIDGRVVELTGITPQMLRDKESWGRRYAKHFQEMASNHWLMGFNNHSFDCPAVQFENERHGYPIEQFERSGDLRKLHRILSNAKGTKGTLKEVAALYGVQPKGALHRAMGDTVLTAETLNAVLVQYGIESVARLLLENERAPDERVRSNPATSKAPAQTEQLSGQLDETWLSFEINPSLGLKDLLAMLTPLGSQENALRWIGQAVDRRKLSAERLIAPARMTRFLPEVAKLFQQNFDGRLRTARDQLMTKFPHEPSLDYLEVRALLDKAGLNWGSRQKESGF